MPVPPSSAYFTAGQSFDLIRAILNDAAGNLFSDTVLLPYFNSAYRKVRRGLAMSGSPLFVSDQTLLVVTAVVTPDPSVQVVLNDQTIPPNQLPTDMIAPTKIWERPNLSTGNFVEMIDLTEHGGLPSVPQSTNLGVWEWRSDGIYFIGATVDTQIRVEYQRALLDAVDGTSQVLIRDSQDCIAYLAAAMAANARGSPLADRWAQAGEDGLENLISAATRREQHTIRRRKPFSSRSGAYSTNSWWGGW